MSEPENNVTELTGLQVHMASVNTSQYRWPDHCSVCYRDMHGIAAHRWAVDLSTDGNLTSRWALAYPELPMPVAIAVCYACWFRALGIEP